MGRQQILERLRTARATVTIPRAEAPEPLPFVRRSSEECAERFLREAAAVGIECWAEPSVADVRARVQSLVAGVRVLAWDPSELPYGIGDVLPAALLGRSPRKEQALADVGLTGCDAAIAETGSLAMISAPGRSRIVSLLPPAHIAIVTPDRLTFSMAEFFAGHAEPLGRAASCTFITGPSRTADIELTLTLGIHGPGRVVVVLGP
jgi:L-lactate dehydrogenase complex protein LldG